MKRLKRQGFSFVEMLVALAILGLLAALLLPAMARSREASARTTCQDNLRQLGTVFLMYSKENKGMYPRMHGDQPFGSRSAAAGCDPASLQDNTSFSPHMPSIAPEYMTDAGIMLCPSNSGAHEPNALLMVRDAGDDRCAHTGLITNADHSYIYFGYLLDRVDEPRTRYDSEWANPGQIQGLMSFMLPALFNRNPLDDYRLDEDADLRAVGLGGRRLGNGGDDTIHRLRSGVVRKVNSTIARHGFIAISESNMPVMWDVIARSRTGGTRFNHSPEGCNVLYLDGHVEFNHYAGRFPLTPNFIDLAGVF